MRSAGFVVLAVAALPAAGQPSFTRIEGPPGSGGGLALGVSADGQYVVGSIHAPDLGGYHPYRWSASGGLEVLPALGAGFILGEGVDVSDNGNAIVGHWRFANPGGLEHTRAFRWSQATGYQVLQPGPGGTYTRVNAASANGSIAAGYSANGNFSSVEGGRWAGNNQFAPTATGTIQDISAAGDVGVGANSDHVLQQHAVRWTSSGVQDLGVLPGHDRSIALGVNRDGSRVVGMSGNGGLTAGSHHAFMWTGAGMQSLGFLAGASRTALTRINDAGTIGIGFAIFDGTPIPKVPIVWTATGGIVRASDFIAGLGLSTGGLGLTELAGLSADGFTMVGYGQQGSIVSGFVVVVPAPAAPGLIAAAALIATRRRR